MVTIQQYNENLDVTKRSTGRKIYSCRFCPARAAEPEDVDHCEPCPVASEKTEQSDT